MALNTSKLSKLLLIPFDSSHFINAPMKIDGATIMMRNYPSVKHIRFIGSSCEPTIPKEVCPPQNECLKRRTFLDWLLGRNKPPPPPPYKKPDIRCCRMRWCKQRNEIHEDPDLSYLGGKAYKTAGIAYIVQKDSLPVNECIKSREQRVLREIETHLDIKKKLFYDDPIKEEDMALRLLEMSDKRLHPLYMKMSATECSEILPMCRGLNPACRVPGVTNIEDVPFELTFNTDLLERKNITWIIKRIEPPTEIPGRTVEFKHNLKEVPVPCEFIRNKDTCENVYDTLTQQPACFFSADDHNDSESNNSSRR